MNERGTALIATLSIAMILLPLGAFVALQCRTDLMIQRNLREEVETFYVAEAGLEHALADIGSPQSLDDILTGPDRVPATADDGLFPFIEGPSGDFPRPPFRYEVQVTRNGSGVMRLSSQASGPHGTLKIVAANVMRSPLVSTPGSLYVEGDVTHIDLGDAGFVLSGVDHRADGTLSNDAADTPIPALATPDPDAGSLLREQLVNRGGERLVGAGGNPSVATTPALDIQRYASRLIGRPDRVTLPAVAAQDLIVGTADAPQLTVADGDVAISGSLSGSGILVIPGALTVTGRLAFTGLILSMGGMVFTHESNVVITGALWRAEGQDQRLQLQGTGSVAYSSRALATVDSAFPGLLPHAVIVTGWQEQL